MSKLFPVILCGGSGVRLWPLSRTSYPKQFMNIEGRTLFGDTLRRALGVQASGVQASGLGLAQKAYGKAGADNKILDACPIILCNEEQRFLAAAALQAEGVSSHIILEPAGRNTAPAIALAALAALDSLGAVDNTDARAANAEGQDPLLLVLPSDHQVEPLAEFNRAVEQAIGCAKAGYLVTFGVTPTRPETGYGYIKQGKALAQGFEVSRFVEKPQMAAAKDMLQEGGFFWNSGMFLFKASVYLQELKKFAPDIYRQCELAWQGRSLDFDFIRPEPEAFLASAANSIDYAVMEQTSLAAMVPLAANWSDLGSWEAFYGLEPKDACHNVRLGDVVALESQGCYLHSTGRLLAALGVNDLLVVETADAVLVAPRGRSQDVKKIVEQLAASSRPEKDEHLRVWRPWGSYEVLAQGPAFKVKRIIVNPGAGLSLQLHHKRAEHWVVVSGRARVTVDGRVFDLEVDQSTYIPIGAVHRLENVTQEPLEIIEVQSGSYLGEDDIVRLEDTYGR